MAAPIEDYALLSDLATGPLVSRNGSVDWLCFPRFDSSSVFTALLGSEKHGRWLIAPAESVAKVVDRHYLESTFVLETTWQTTQGQVLVTDFMPVRRGRSSLLRRITGLWGQFPCVMNFFSDPLWSDHGVDEPRAPWPWRGNLLAMAGPDACALHGRQLPEAHEQGHIGEFTVAAGEKVDFELMWFPSYRETPATLDFDAALKDTVDYWTRWGDHCRQDGAYGDHVMRSLLVLRALTHYETGGIVAAPTASLPEDFGGSRNWDYRYCWLPGGCCRRSYGCP